MASHTKTTPAESARLQRALADVRPKIQQILKNCKYKPAGLIQPAVDDIKRMCIDADLAYTIPIFGRNCGIHPDNRAGTGVDPFNAHRLALKITNQGYSESKLENPMGFEPAGTETAASAQRRNMQMKFNATNFAEANGYLKEIAFYDVTYLPVTCAHTFAALNIIEGECKGLNKEFIGDTGFVDKEKVLKLCPSWKKAMEDGIPCTVFRRELEEACPDLAAFLSKAGNQSHDVHSKETMVQLMLALHQMYGAKTGIGTVPAESASSDQLWDQIAAEMIIMKPHFKDAVPEAIKFVREWSGGEDCAELLEAETFAKSLKLRREPDRGQVGLLAGANIRRAPKWPTMCVKTLMCGAEQFCRGENCARMFTSTDIKNMETTKLPEIMAAIQLVDKAREWVHRDINNAWVVTLIGEMEVRLVMHVHGIAKKVKTRTQFKSMLAIAQQLAFDVQQAKGDMKQCPWQPHNSHPTAAASAGPAASVTGIVPLEKDGKMSDGTLKAHYGMALGDNVQLRDKKKDAEVYMIGSIEHGMVNMISTGSDTTKTVSTAELADLYQPCKHSEDIVLRNQKFLKLEQHGESGLEQAKSRAKMLLYEAFRLHQSGTNVDIKVTANRTRHIFAGEKYQNGQLKLVAYSPSVFNAAAEGKDRKPSNAYVQLKVRSQKETFVVTFSPVNFKPDPQKPRDNEKQLVVPFWMVRATGDKDRANMAMSTIKCTMNCQVGKHEAAEESVLVPILQNTKCIKENEELLVFKESLMETVMSIETTPSKKGSLSSAGKRPLSNAGKRPNLASGKKARTS